MTATIRIEKDIPIPTSRFGLELLEPGDSLAFPLAERARVNAARTRAQAKFGTKYKMRRQGELIRIWRLE